MKQQLERLYAEYQNKMSAEKDVEKQNQITEWFRNESKKIIGK